MRPLWKYLVVTVLLQNLLPVYAEKIPIMLTPSPQHPFPMEELMDSALRISEVTGKICRDTLDDSPFEFAIMDLCVYGLDGSLNFSIVEVQEGQF